MRTPTPLRARALLLLALTGCPPTPGPTPPPSTDTAPVPSAGTTTEPKDPLAGSIFTKDEVLAIYRAEHAAGLPGATDAAKAERDRVLRQHKLVDSDGDDVPARMGAYERALEALAKDEASWAEFVETLPR